MRKTSRTQARFGRQTQVVIDVLAWAVGLTWVDLVRYDFEPGDPNWRGLALAIGAAAVLQVVVGTALLLYRRRYRYGSFEEVAGLAATVAITTGILVALDLGFRDRPIPLSVALAGGIPALVVMCSTRYAWRWGSERRRRPNREGVSRMVVFGAGDGGQQVLDALLRDPGSPYLPVALLDDDPAKRNLRVRGVPVAGGRAAMVAARHKYRADSLLIAIPTADAALVRDITTLADEAQLDVKVLPPVRDLIDGHIGLGDIRDVEVTDLLGRRQVETDIDAIAGYLTGKRVLVTGAGGSIGSELCRQIHQLGPAELVMLDRDETALHSVELSIHGRALLDDASTVLADIRDADRLTCLFAQFRPHVVFHAAALKHLPLLERHPGEALKSNVLGTLNVLEAAERAGVWRFVNISTDKAAAPTSVLGASKRIGERLTADVARRASGTYMSVRFGNVLASRGSVLTTFQAQIAAGGPVTVTHRDVTRYFMTVQEAVELVVQAGAIGRDGEVLVLDMGEPVRIDDVAHRLVSQAPRAVQVVYTGLREGEKLHEDLFGPGEGGVRRVHELIWHVPAPPLAPEHVLRLDQAAPAADVVAALHRLCDGTPDDAVVFLDR